MTETVQCRVCGCPSPLGTAECPDCGAPLPRELPRKETPGPEAAQTEETAAPVPEKKELSPKLRRARRAALFAAVCLVVQLAAALWPQKYQPAGMTYSDDGIVTMDGLWDLGEEGFWIIDGTTDGRYLILQARGEESQSKARGVADALSSVQLSYTFAPTGDYYLFDGRTLERTDWATATVAGSAVFFTQEDENGVTLGCRDLETGRTHRIERFEGTGQLNDLHPATDGTAAAYRWTADGGQEPEAYRLWRAGDRKPVAVDVPAGDTLWGVGRDGESCLFWRMNGEGQKNGLASIQVYRGELDGGYHYYDYDYYLWRNGEITPLPNMMLAWGNTAFTEFLLREEREDHNGAWYYYEVDAMAAPVRLDVSVGDYLMPTALSRGSWRSGYDFETLKGRFYMAYASGSNTVYYLTHKGELLVVEEELEGDFRLDETGQNAVYLKNGELYRVSVLPNDTLETQRLTHTGDTVVSGEEWGAVTDFAVSGDLSHIYYVARDAFELYSDVKLYHWQGGESRALDMELARNQKLYLAVTPAGGCYFVYRQDLYYTEDDKAPVAVMEEEAVFSAAPQLIGPRKWAMAVSIEWAEGSQRQNRYWRLNGYDAPVELTEWIPKEGKV